MELYAIVRHRNERNTALYIGSKEYIRQKMTDEFGDKVQWSIVGFNGYYEDQHSDTSYSINYFGKLNGACEISIN